ncbi:RNA-binding protein 48 [Chanos chanos]|uniref:RNA-binding protein 48 n=1 Tax=Chanos chanos TaxID=29144 RepID=A0A6J2WM41_CHACN|nr:RNA-binding protein 48 [Chanos chanos]
MASSEECSVWKTPKVYKHHEQQSVCYTRPKYREGRRLRAVKVYTINLESRFLLVQGVPAIGVMTELIQLFALYGVIEEYRVLDEYPAEQFTEVYLIKFQKLTSARAAKRNTDEKSFYGGLLHVCYAPEYETVEDTRQKLQDRRRYVNRVCQNKVKQIDLTNEKSITPSCSNTLRAPIPQNEEEEYGYEHNGQNSNTSCYSGVPLLPLPPQEGHPPSKGALRDRIFPAEDKMGSLHQFTDTREQPTVCLKQDSFSHGNRPASGKTFNPTPSVRFMPRPAHLESRKRKMEDKEDTSLDVTDNIAPIIGPKLPEPPKIDMEDESLNITANLIRNKITKIATVPELKPAEKNTTTPKPRRRI